VDQGLAGLPGRNDAEPRLRVASATTGDAVVITPSGELDQDTADLLQEQLDAALQQEGRRLVIDCTDLLFCDSTGLNVMLAARLRAEAQGRRVHLAGLRPVVARVMEITGAEIVFSVHGTLEEALTAPEDGGHGEGEDGAGGSSAGEGDPVG